MTTLKDPKEFIFTPNALATAGVAAVEKMHGLAGASMNLGIPGPQSYFVPSMPGQLNLILAQTHHYKTQMLRLIARNYANQLKEQQRQELVLFVQVEETIEETAYEQIAMYSDGEEYAGRLARGEYRDWNNVLKASVGILSDPVFYLGESILSNPDEMPPLTVGNMAAAADHIQNRMFDHPMRFAGIFVDYLQAIPFDPAMIKLDPALREKRLQIRHAVYELRRFARKYQCPLWLGVQAKQKLDKPAGEKMRIPTIYDGEESSSIAQRADRIIQLWMPKNDYTIGSKFFHNGIEYQVKENMLFLKVGKQKGGLPSGKAWCMEVDFMNNEMRPDPQYHGGRT